MAWFSMQRFFQKLGILFKKLGGREGFYEREIVSTNDEDEDDDDFDESTRDTKFEVYRKPALKEFGKNDNLNERRIYITCIVFFLGALGVLFLIYFVL